MDRPAEKALIRAPTLAFLGDLAGFTTRILGDRPPLPGTFPVFMLRQVHSNRVIHVRKLDDPRLVRRAEADGLVTTDPGTALAIRVADCVPVLVSTMDGRAVAALHAGWRGIASGVLARGIALLCDAAGCTAGDLAAAAGPAIGPCCYEVDGETGRRIASLAPEGVLADAPAAGKVMADLWRAVVNQLLSAGIPGDRIGAHRTCTRCNRDLFHSFRRDGPRSGRQIGFIATRPDPCTG